MKKKHTIGIRLLLLILLVVVVWLGWSIWSSYHMLQTNFYTIESEQLDSSIRMAVLADLHDNRFGKENKKLIQRVSDLEPNVIFMVGDMVNDDSKDHQAVIDLVSKLVEVAPVYYSVGNHELGYVEQHPQLWEELVKAGAFLVDKSYIDVEVCGQPLRIGGLYDYAFALDGFNFVNLGKMDPQVAEFLLKFQDTDRYKIMLAHRPDSFIFSVPQDYWKIDLVISGHVHGGQVVVPFVGGLWAPDQGYFPEYTHGLYKLGDITMALTSGLGSNKQILPRYNNPPELMVIDLE